MMANSHRTARKDWAPMCPTWEPGDPLRRQRCEAPPVAFHYSYDGDQVTVDVYCTRGHTWTAQWMARGEPEFPDADDHAYVGDGTSDCTRCYCPMNAHDPAWAATR